MAGRVVLVIQAVTMYRAVCDCCGKEDDACDTREDAAVDLLDYGWTVDESGTVRCDWCHEHDYHAACERSGGHHWDTAGNRNRASFWAGGDDGEPEFQLRSCGVCGHMQKRDRGGGWFGYRHGRWLGDLQEAT